VPAGAGVFDAVTTTVPSRVVSLSCCALKYPAPSVEDINAESATIFNLIETPQ
jgi:hypothetical protein